MAAQKQIGFQMSTGKKLIRYIQSERNQKKSKENNLGKGQQSRKLVEKQELGRSRFPVLGGRQEYVWGLCYRAPIVSKCVEE